MNNKIKITIALAVLVLAFLTGMVIAKLTASPVNNDPEEKTVTEILEEAYKTINEN